MALGKKTQNHKKPKLNRHQQS